MEKLVMNRDDEFYRLEVNDKGEYIEFDLTDITLPVKILEASKELSRIHKMHDKGKEKIIQENKENVNKMNNLLIEYELKICKKMRDIFDSFLGEGACQKIFGDKNNYGMFENLMDALEPHFEKMKIKMEKAKKKLIDKYMPKNSDVM